MANFTGKKERQVHPSTAPLPGASETGTIEALLAEANSAFGTEAQDSPPTSNTSRQSRHTQESVSEHLAVAQRALTASHQQALNIVAECVESVRSTMEAEMRELKEHLRRLSELQRKEEELHDQSREQPAPNSSAVRTEARSGLRPPSLIVPSSTDPVGRRQTEPSGLGHATEGGLPGQLTGILPDSNRRRSVTPPPLPSQQDAQGSEASTTRRPQVLFANVETASERKRRSSMFSTSSSMFADADQMKAKIRQSIAKPVYNVTDYYKSRGPWQRVARSTWFEQLTLVVIGINAIWIGIDTDYNKSVLISADAFFIVMENLFCVFFCVEWLVRYMSFRQTLYALRDSWFVFDSILVVISVMETWVMTLILLAANNGSADTVNIFDTDASTLRLLRLLRLSRMARMARLFRAIPELMIVMKGLVAAIRSVLVTLVMLTLIIYVFGIAFTSLMEGTPPGTKYFSDVRHSMASLLLHGVFLEEIPSVYNGVGEESPVYGGLLLLFVLVASFLVVNMLIGVMVETVHVVSAVEREQLSVTFTKDKLQHMLQTTNLDANGDNKISKAEFGALLQIPDAVRALQELGVDVVGLVDLSEFVFESGSQLEFPAFMDMVLQLRGSNKATVKDVVDLRKFMRQEINHLRRMVEQTVCSRLATEGGSPRGSCSSSCCSKPPGLMAALGHGQ